MDVTLDETHAEVLRELDRQIDLLSTGPQPSSLPPFSDTISLSNTAATVAAPIHGTPPGQAFSVGLNDDSSSLGNDREEPGLSLPFSEFTATTNGRESCARRDAEEPEEAMSFGAVPLLGSILNHRQTQFFALHHSINSCPPVSPKKNRFP
jgi:hypothetical protein